jgi:hypothetical protein
MITITQIREKLTPHTDLINTPYWDSRRGFWLDIGFIHHLHTHLRTTLNYSAIANLHTLQITTA